MPSIHKKDTSQGLLDSFISKKRKIDDVADDSVQSPSKKPMIQAIAAPAVAHTTTTNLTAEQVERMERNRQLALQKLAQKKKQDFISEITSTIPDSWKVSPFFAIYLMLL